MKKIATIGLVGVVILIIVIIQIANIQKQERNVIEHNKQYEFYENKELYGIDVVTIMNKAIYNNEKYNISKDKDGIYIDDKQNSIKVELNLIFGVNEKTNQNIMITKQMEDLQRAGLEKFIQNFNLTTFKCREIEYHKKTGKVSKILVEQVEL